MSSDASKPLFAGLLAAVAKAVGAGPKKRVVLLIDNAGFHARPDLAERQTDFGSRTNFSWRRKNHSPS